MSCVLSGGSEPKSTHAHIAPHVTSKTTKLKYHGQNTSLGGCVYLAVSVVLWGQILALIANVSDLQNMVKNTFIHSSVRGAIGSNPNHI